MPPGPGARIAIAYQGPVAPEAEAAFAQLREEEPTAGLLAMWLQYKQRRAAAAGVRLNPATVSQEAALQDAWSATGGGALEWMETRGRTRFDAVQYRKAGRMGTAMSRAAATAPGDGAGLPS